MNRILNFGELEVKGGHDWCMLQILYGRYDQPKQYKGLSTGIL